MKYHFKERWIQFFNPVQGVLKCFKIGKEQENDAFIAVLNDSLYFPQSFLTFTSASFTSFVNFGANIFEEKIQVYDQLMLIICGPEYVKVSSEVLYRGNLTESQM